VHHADAVQKSRVGGAGKHQAENVVLADIAQALEQRVVYNLYFMAVQGDGPVNRVHNQFVVGSEQVVYGAPHDRLSLKLMILLVT
jgi:hypothetical protein